MAAFSRSVTASDVGLFVHGFLGGEWAWLGSGRASSRASGTRAADLTCCRNSHIHDDSRRTKTRSAKTGGKSSFVM
jgi:hypothetical protein